MGIREYFPGVYIDLYQNVRGLSSQEQDYAFAPISLRFDNGSAFFFYSQLNKQNLTSSFNPVHTVILPGSYTFWQHVLDYTSDRSKHLSGEVTATLGRYFNGSTHEFLVNARYSPDPHAVAFLSYDINKLSHIGEFKQNITTRLFSTGTQLYWNPKLILNGLVEYNSVESSLNYNFKFSWEYNPLSFIYLVLTNLKDRYTGFGERQYINKISFVKQF